DVDELAARQPLAQDVPGDDRGRVPRECEIGVLVVLLRDREGRARVDHRLHGRADGARIGDVVAQVRAVVDARRDEVEPVAEVAEEGEADGIGRRAIDRVGERAVLERPLADTQRAHQRLLMADRALIRIRRDDRHVTHLLERLLEGEESARFDAVVVGHEDPRPAGPFRHRAARGAQGARAAAPGATRQRFAALLVEVAPLTAGALAGHVRRIGTPRPRSFGLGSFGVDLAGCRCGVGSLRVVAHGSGTSTAWPGVGSRGTTTARPSRSLTLLAARPATLRSPAVRCRKWKKNADTTAAMGIPKIAPGIPAILEPMRTDPRTTIGWIPTAPCMIRGCRTFMTSSHPTPMIAIVG